ncbi:UvrD-helicase domain-containing protein [Mycolicibacterium wolinskyi]|uniref:UvrD-helicase domain-containing protein n=1 Tax=Mycolicibacterium wolinskyi TaxID=59750 RepID=UPI0039176EC1
MTFELAGQAREAYDQDGRVMVLGGPGSGKTTLSLLKTQRLIPTLEPGQQILFLSFSRAAVRQVMLRCRDVLTASERTYISVQTYHAYCMDILRAHGRLLTGSPARILFPDREKVVKTNFNGDWSDERRRLAIEEGVYAFDQFASGAASLIGGVPKVAELVADRFPVIILDEFQDTSDAQWELVQALALRSNVIILADPDQRIFEYDDNVDPDRLNHVRQILGPAEFDLGGENHRSPDAGILQFADAILRNRTLPVTSDVIVRTVYPRALESTTHTSVLWLFGELRKKGIERPNIAVLTRANSLVSDVSSWLSSTRTFNGTQLKPVSHDVLWDAEVTAAAAQVVASILEWPLRDSKEGVMRTLSAVANFYEVKNALKVTASAAAARDSYRTNAELLVAGKNVRLKSAKQLIALRENGFELRGDPASDWKLARDVIAAAGVHDIIQAVRFVRLFGATDEIGGRLAEQWDRSGGYDNAVELVRRTLDQGRITSELREPQGCILMNVHKSKGKEFDGVIIVEGHYRSTFYDRREDPPHMSGRRLLRVAVTRARHKVVIVRPNSTLPLINP